VSLEGEAVPSRAAVRLKPTWGCAGATCRLKPVQHADETLRSRTLCRRVPTSPSLARLTRLTGTLLRQGYGG